MKTKKTNKTEKNIEEALEKTIQQLKNEYDECRWWEFRKRKKLIKEGAQVLKTMAIYEYLTKSALKKNGGK